MWYVPVFTLGAGLLMIDRAEGERVCVCGWLHLLAEDTSALLGRRKTSADPSPLKTIQCLMDSVSHF